MTDQPSNLWLTSLNALLAAETERAALEAAVSAVAELFGGPAVGILKGRAEHLSSVTARGREQWIAPLFVEALSQAGLRLASRPMRYQELVGDQRIVAIPLRVDNRVLGVICGAADASGPAPEATHVAMLELALVRTVERIRHQAETQLLYEISLRLSSTFDLPQLLHEVLELTVAIFAAKASRIFLADERTDDLVMTLNPNPQAPGVETLRTPIDGTIAGWVVRHGAGLIRNDPYDGRFPMAERETGISSSKLICVPLKQAGRALGALMLVNQHDDPDFLDEDLRLLTTIAGTITIMIANARLYQRAIRDALTGAYNRGAFDSTLRRHWSRWEQTGVGFALLLLDLDDFKQINDRFGHSIGDSVLQTVARLLWEALREEDGIFRYGGEEFCVLLSNLTNPEVVAQIAERLRAVLDREMTISSLVRVRLSASIGVVLHPLHGARTTHSLLDLADNAAYRAKRNGKNRVEIVGIDDDLTTFPPYGT